MLPTLPTIAIAALIAYALLAIHRSIITDLKKKVRDGGLLANLLSRKPLGCSLCMSWWYSLATAIGIEACTGSHFNWFDFAFKTAVLALASTGVISAFRHVYPDVEAGSPYVDSKDDTRPPIA